MMTPLTIAYVEDDPRHVETIRRMLGTWLVNPIDVYRDGEQLLRRLEEQGDGQKPGVVLVDMSLPGLSGSEIVRRIRSDHADMIEVPKVIVAGTDDPDEIHRAEAAGADAYIVKPIKIHALMEVLNSVARMNHVAPYRLQILR